MLSIKTNASFFVSYCEAHWATLTHGFQWTCIWERTLRQVTEWRHSCRWRAVFVLSQDQCKMPWGVGVLQCRRSWRMSHSSSHLNVDRHHCMHTYQQKQKLYTRTSHQLERESSDWNLCRSGGGQVQLLINAAHKVCPVTEKLNSQPPWSQKTASLCKK